MNICLIPARSGSKRIKNKNIKTFCGKPIIEWVIKNVKKTHSIPYYADYFCSCNRDGAGIGGRQR